MTTFCDANDGADDVDTSMIVEACEVMTTFCDAFSHQLLAVNDDDFLKRHHHSLDGPNVPTFRDQLMNSIPARYVVHVLRAVLNDLYWVRPVLASDITNSLTDPDSILRFQRARLPVFKPLFKPYLPCCELPLTSQR